MKKQYKVIQWTTSYEENTPDDGSHPILVSTSSTFLVELFTVDMLGINTVYGQVYVTIPNVSELTTEVDQNIQKHLAELGVLEDIPDTLLEKTKQNKWAEIVTYRDGLEKAGFNYLGKIFDSDAVSVTRILGLASAAQSAMALGQEMSIEWTVADNSTITLNIQDILGLPLALANHSNALHIKAKEIKAKIENAKSETEVLAITWETI